MPDTRGRMDRRTTRGIIGGIQLANRTEQTPVPCVKPRLQGPPIPFHVEGKRSRLHQKTIWSSGRCKSNSHRVLPYLQRLCSLLQIKAFIVSIGGRQEKKPKVVFAMQLATLLKSTPPPKKKASLHLLFSATLKNVKFPSDSLRGIASLFAFSFSHPTSLIVDTS